MANGVIVIRTGSRYVRYNEATVNAVISMRFVVRLKQLVHTAGNRCRVCMGVWRSREGYYSTYPVV